ncbi:hypothetical protein CF70_007590 [Cupriavidus sp. SK-3]|nr:hypothetical protein CF70_007590 [Cupriavidus sp. SK-3]
MQPPAKDFQSFQKMVRDTANSPINTIRRSMMRIVCFAAAAGPIPRGVALPRIAVAVIPHLPSLIRAFGLPDRPMPAAGDPAHRRLYLHQPIAMPRKFPS